MYYHLHKILFKWSHLFYSDVRFCKGKTLPFVLPGYKKSEVNKLWICFCFTFINLCTMNHHATVKYKSQTKLFYNAMTNTLFKAVKRDSGKKTFFFIKVMFCRQVFKYMAGKHIYIMKIKISSKNNNRKIYILIHRNDSIMSMLVNNSCIT